MKILIVDDHAIVREGCRRLLATMEGAVILEATNQADALQIFRRDAPDVVILDIDLGTASGLELLQRLRAEVVPARVVMFTMHADANYATRALAAGALGFIGKSAPAEELIAAVKRVAEGQRYIDPELADDMVRAPATGDDPMSRLTNREVEILRLLGEGKSLTEIAGTFGIAYKTVANTCSRLKEKLNLARTADLIRVSLENRGR